MKTKRLLIPFAILMILVLLAQGGLSLFPRVTAQAAPGAEPAVFLPLVVGWTPPPPSTVFGIGVNDLTNANILSKTQEANPTWIRQDGLNWSLIQPTKDGGYDWSSASSVEADMIKASQLGYKWIQIVRGTPDWAQKYSGSVCGPIKESEFVSYANFLKAAIDRYSKPPYNVIYWEIYNEPDAPVNNNDSGWGCWGDGSQPYFGGQYYGDMLATVIPEMRQADPDIKILNGGLLLDCNPAITTCGIPGMSEFLEGMAKSGAVGLLDYVNFHAYDYQGVQLGVFLNDNWGTDYSNNPSLVAKAAFVRNVLNQYGLGDKPLMDSELALLKTFDTCDAVCEQNKALYIGRAYPAAIAEGFDAGIWYQADNSWKNSGLYDGPMYDAFKFAREELADAKVTRKITEYEGSANVSGYELDRGDIKIWVIWSQDLANHDINMPGTPKAVNTWTADNGPYGSVTPSTLLNVGMFPVYIEWSK